MPLDVFTQWSTAAPLINAGPAWVSADDRERIASYSLYEQIYKNIPEAFELSFRGDDENPLYIPSAKQIVNTLHRYLANGLSVITDPNLGTENDQAKAMAALSQLFRRERFASRFSTNKRYGIIRGDWLFHIYADDTREAGSRISIFPVDPGGYFPITNPDNVDEVIGIHIAEQITEGDKTYVYRLTYRKASGRAGPSPITVEEAVFEPDDWEPNDAKPVRVIRPMEELPDPINQLPVYHIQNADQPPSSLWGTSELSGLERILTGVNQTVTDEDLALALESLCVYATDGGAPIDRATNQPVPWNIGPGRVIELGEGKKFERVNGVSTVTPYQDHLKYLHSQIDLSVAQPAVARGRVDVAVAESGIALVIELGPLLSRVEEGELVVTDVMTNMLFDLKAWFQAYEGLSFGDAVWIPKYGDKIPVNRKQRFDEIMQMFTAGASGGAPLVSASWVRQELAKIGYSFPDDTTMMDEILGERQIVGQIDADITGARMDQELEDITGGPAT